MISDENGGQLYLARVLFHIKHAIACLSWMFLFFFSEKQRELYQNAKNVKKYKKMLKRQNLQNDPLVAERHIEV
jgi:hypothetical protein